MLQQAKPARTAVQRKAGKLKVPCVMETLSHSDHLNMVSPKRQHAVNEEKMRLRFPYVT